MNNKFVFIGFKWSGIVAIICIVGLAAFKQPKSTLKVTFKNMFHVGTALNRDQVFGKDTNALKLARQQFNSITAENDMKWEKIHPKPNTYNFAPADSFVSFGEKNGMFIIGHCLIWHAQTPKWVFEDKNGKPVGRDTLLNRMRDHISAIVGRYKNRVNGWDVVNEALEENGQLRKSKWLQIIGEDYIQKAFEYAKEADPNAELYYNDYNIEQPEKRGPVLLKLIKDLKARGVKIDGVGIQAHWHLDVPKLGDIDASIQDFAALGAKVMFTELDINVLPRPENLSGADVSTQFKLTPASNPYPVSLPDSVQDKLAGRYADFFKIFLKYKGVVSRVTFWGIHDGMSWLNGWPIKGRTNYPLLFDRNYKEKPAFYAVIKTKEGK